MGWGSEGAARLDFFGVKSTVGFACARLAGAASNNKPTRSRLAEGSRLHVLPSRSRPSTRLDAWEGDLSAEAEIISSISSCVCVYTMLRGGEGRIKKSRDVAALPRGGGMPLRRQNYGFLRARGSKSVQGWGEGA